MGEDRAQSSEWRMPTAAAGALQLSSRLARPTAWAEQLSARSRPLVVGAFGAELAGRFSTVSSPGVLALSLAERFLPSQSQASAAELTLGPHGSPQRAVGVARWSALPPSPGPTPFAASAPLLAELSALGWGEPPSPARSERPEEPTTPTARRAPDQRAAAPHAPARPEIPAAPPAVTPDTRSGAATSVAQRTPEAPFAEIPPAGAPLAPPGSAPITRQAEDAPAAMPGEPARHTRIARQPDAPTGGPVAQPVGDLPVVRRSVPQAPSPEATTPAAQSRRMGAQPVYRTPSSSPAPAPATSAPSAPPPLRPAVLRSPALLRPLPPDPLRRMGVVPQGAEIPVAPGVNRSATLPLVLPPGEAGAPPHAPIARHEEPAATSAAAPPAPSEVLAGLEPAMAASAPARDLPQPGPMAREGATAIAQVRRSPAVVSAAPSLAAPPSLTTLLLQRHAAGSGVGGAAPLVLLRTRPPAAPLQRSTSGGARPYAESSRDAGAAAVHGAAPGGAADRPIGRSAALAVFPSAGPPEHTMAGVVTTAMPLAQLDMPAPTSGPASGAPDAGPIARVADWGALPLLQRSADMSNLAERSGRRSLAQRHAIMGATPPAIVSAGAAHPAETVWRSAETYGGAATSHAAAPLAPSESPTLAALSGTPGGYETWSLPALDLQAPAAGAAERAGASAGTLPLLQRRAAAPAAGIPGGAFGYALPALDLAQPARTEVQRAPSDEPAPAPTAPPSGSQATAGAQEAGQESMNIDAIAQKVYEHLRRRLLVEHERRGRPL